MFAIRRILLVILLVGLTSAVLLSFLIYSNWHIGARESVAVDFSPSHSPAASEWDMLLGRSEYVLHVCCQHSSRSIPAFRDARGPVRMFEVRDTDPPVRLGYRAELRLRPDYMGHDRWYQGRIFVPADWVNVGAPVIAMQWHATRNIFLGELGTLPPLALAIHQGAWHLSKAWTKHWYAGTDRPVEGVRDIAKVALTTGAWSEWKFHVRWAPDETGFIKAWLNGKPVVDEPGPIGYRDLFGPYLKVGVYIPAWSSTGPEPNIATRVLVFDVAESAASAAALHSSATRIGERSE